MNVYEKLQIVQCKLKAPKGQYNSFGRYSYRSCEDVLEALKPLLNEIKAVVVIEDELVQLGDRFYIKATASFIDINTEADQIIKVSAYAREEENKKGMDGSQVTGASSSYARKYALNGLFAIDDNKDSDYTNTDNKKNEPKAPVTPKKAPEPKAPVQESKGISDAQIKRMFAMATHAGVKSDELKELIKKAFKVEDLHTLTREQYDRICAKYEVENK